MFAPLFSPARIDLRRRTQALREELVGKIQAMFPSEIAIERRGGRWRSRLRLASGLMVNVVVCRSIAAGSRGLIWQINPIAHEWHHVTLLAFLDGNNRNIQDMLLFPYIDRQRRFRVTTDHAWPKLGTPLKSTSQFLEVIQTYLRNLENTE